jgi:predicted site-specific integrase-resolvase
MIQRSVDRRELVPGYLPLNEAAEWVGVSQRTLKRWISLGLPCYQGVRRGKVLVKVEDIERFLTRRQVAQPNLDAIVGEVFEELQGKRE